MTQYNYNPSAALLGSAGTVEDALIASRKYPKRAEAWTVTIAGTASAGVYSFDMQSLPQGLGNITVSFTRASENNDGIAAGLEAAFDANDDLRALFTTAVASNVLTITQRELGGSFDIANDTAAGTGTLTSAESVAGSKASLGLGLAVALSGPRQIRLPTTGDAYFDGVTYRGHSNLNTLPVAGIDNSVNDAFDAGAVVGVLKKGTIWVTALEAVTAGDPVAIGIDGSQTPGGFYTGADSNTIRVQGEYETSGAIGDLVLVRVNFPGN